MKEATADFHCFKQLHIWFFDCAHVNRGARAEKNKTGANHRAYARSSRQKWRSLLHSGAKPECQTVNKYGFSLFNSEQQVQKTRRSPLLIVPVAARETHEQGRAPHCHPRQLHTLCKLRLYLPKEKPTLVLVFARLSSQLGGNIDRRQNIYTAGSPTVP